MKLSVLSALSASVLLLAACSTPSTPGTTAQAVAGFAKGVITAKGSIWVNGVEYQTTGSTVHVDGTAGGDADLKVGMVVQLNATIDPVTGKAVAETVNYESSVKGTVDASSIDTAAKTFAVFGQPILVTGTTVFEGTTDLTTLAAGNFVEVSGQVDPTSATTPKTLVADRVEYKAVPGTEPFKLKGTVSGLSASSFTLTLEEGQSFTVNFTGTLHPAVANGSRVRVSFTAAPSSGTLSTDAASIRVRSTELHPDNGDRTEIHGVVSAYTPGATASDPVTFTLDGQAVSAGPALFTIPNAGVTLDGFRAEVEGTLTAGVLVAKKVHIERQENDAALQEMTGTVTAVDLTAATLTVRHGTDTPVTLAVTADTIFHDPAWTGTAPLSKLVVGSDLVEVRYLVEGAVNTALKVERQ